MLEEKDLKMKLLKQQLEYMQAKQQKQKDQELQEK